MDNCFYCQGLKNYQPQKGGKCGFCNVYNNPLYLVFYKEKGKYYCFCCGLCLMAISAKWKRERGGKQVF